MTRTEQAIEAIAIPTAEYAWNCPWGTLAKSQQNEAIRFTRSLLSLPAPDGLPWLVVRSEDQTMQVQGAIPALDAQEVMRQIRAQGFVRVEQPEK